MCIEGKSEERKGQAMTNAALRGKPDAGNPHVRFDEGEVALAATPRRGSLLYKKTPMLIAVSALCAAALPSLADTDIYGNEIFSYTEGGVQKTYKFWVSGTKAEIATKNDSAESSSSSASLATGTYSTPAAQPIALEARFRTWLESMGTSINSTLMRGFRLIFR